VAIYVIVLGLYLAVHYLRNLWTLDSHGLSTMTERLPYWDFTNLWGASRLALQGHVADLFDVDAYRQELRALFTPFMPDQEWSYPPSLLLFGLPLAMLPVLPAYLLWTACTLLLLFLSLKTLDLPLGIRLLILLSPAACIDLMFGQNGALTAALLLSGLALLPRRPIMAGILLGLLTVKPQLGLLVPFCLLAGGHYRAIGSAAITAILLVLVTGVAFGWDVWPLFLEKTRPLMSSIMEAPYPQGYQKHGATFFLLFRSLGLGLPASYALQGLFTAAGIAAAFWLWRPERRIDPATRVCLTGVLTLVAMPYGYVYDAVPLNIAAAFFFRKRREPALLLAIAWIYPLINSDIVEHTPLIGVLVPFTLAAWTLRNIWKEQTPPISDPNGESSKVSAAPLAG
jgi:hypothetical protein